jgi:putative MATE family efflux protein
VNRETTPGHGDVPGMFDGPVLPVLVRLGLPILAGMTVQLLYSVVDAFWVTRIDPSNPAIFGGVGLVFPIVFFAIALGNGLLIGTSSLVARAVGAREHKVLSRVVESGLAISVVLAVLVITVGYTFGEDFVRLLGAEGEYFRHGYDYFRHIVPGAALMFVGAVFNGVLQGEGLMRHLMISIVLGTALNIVLDPILIFVVGLGVPGAALATVVAQTAAVVYSVQIVLRKKALSRVEWKASHVDVRVIGRIVSVGLPQSVNQILLSLTFLILNGIVVAIDPKALTAFALVGRMDQIVLTPIFATASTLVTMVGQNVGRGLYDRVRRIWRTGIALAASVVAVLAGLLMVGAPVLYRAVTADPDVLAYAVRQTRVVELSFAFAAVTILGRSLFQAMGHPIPALIITSLRMFAIAIPMVYLLVNVFDLGMYGVWFGVVVGNVASGFITFGWAASALERLRTGRLRGAVAAG